MILQEHGILNTVPVTKIYSFASEAAQQTSSKSNANIAEKLIRLPPHK